MIMFIFKNDIYKRYYFLWLVFKFLEDRGM